MWRNKRKFAVQLDDAKPDLGEAYRGESRNGHETESEGNPEWTECWDEKHQCVYYWNQLTNETKWELTSSTSGSPSDAATTQQTKLPTPVMAKPDSFRNLIIGGKPKLPETLRETQSSPALATLVSSYGSDAEEDDSEDTVEPKKKLKVDKKAEFRQRFSKELYGFSQDSTADEMEFAKKSKEAQLKSLDRVGFQKMNFIKSDLLLPKSLETSGGSRTKENGNSTADVYCQTETPEVSDLEAMESRNSLLSRLEHFGVTAELVSSSQSALTILYLEMKTLTKAFDQGFLPLPYLDDFFQQADMSLRRYESESVPSGWEMLWDRDSSKYQYRNRETKEVQFTYPSSDETTKSNRSPPPLPADPYPSLVEPPPPPPPPSSNNCGVGTKTEDDEYELFMRSLMEENILSDSETGGKVEKTPNDGDV